MQNDDGERRAAGLLRNAAAQLAAASVPDEALGVYEEPKSLFGIKREPVMRDLGRVWRLGAILLDRDGNAWATGSITRVVDPGRAQFVAQSMELRRAYRAAAVRGGFAVGDTVNHGAVPIMQHGSLIDDSEGGRGGSGAIVLTDDGPFVRWSPTAATLVPLQDYLRDRVDLLVHPPEGAGD